MMLQDQNNPEIEEKIKNLFKKIQFTKSKNQILFAKWKKNSLEFVDAPSINHITDFLNAARRNHPMSSLPSNQDQILRRRQIQQDRQQLLQQLEELMNVLNTQGEDAAERLLKQNAHSLPTILKWLAIFILIILVGFVVKAIIVTVTQ